MDTKQVVEDFMTAFEKGDREACLACLSDDFTFSGPVPKPLNAHEWIGTAAGMLAGLPDINYNMKIVGVDGEKATVSSQLAGTHTADLDLSKMGLGLFPATGKSFSNPEEQGVMTVANGKITSYDITPVEGGGLMGILTQLGVSPPGP